MIRQRWDVMRGVLDEPQRRLFVDAEATVLGRGGISAVAAATGVSRGIVSAGLGELAALTASDAPAEAASPRVVRVRRPGWGAQEASGQRPDPGSRAD